MRESDFNRLLKVFNREKIDEPALFEIIYHWGLIKYLAGYSLPEKPTEKDIFTYCSSAYAAAGNDHINYCPASFHFTHLFTQTGKPVSMNECGLITDWESFNKYPWPDPGAADYSILDMADSLLPGKMKILLGCPYGIVENVMGLFGYDNLCFLIYDDPKLVMAVCNAVGERLLEYYKIGLPNSNVGGTLYCDDWGFNSGPLFSPDFFRDYIFPWVKKITDLSHKNGKPAVLHSCGKIDIFMDTIIDDLKFNGKHSFEDKIMPIEEAYMMYGNRIALLGGIDVDFLSRSPKEKIYNRSLRMLESGKSGYALGTGNSVTDYIPQENYSAMISAAGISI